jgi:hypothetical protein
MSTIVTASLVVNGVVIAIPAALITSIAAAAVVAPVITPPAPPPVPPVPPAPVTALIQSPVYENGKFHWAGDWDSVPVNYAFNAPGVNGPGPVINMPGTNAWEYWLPYPPPNAAGPATNGVNFNISTFSYITFALKPSVAGGLMQVSFYESNGATDDIYNGVFLNITQAKYGPVPTPGVWGVYTIPLADFKLTNRTWIYKFIMQQQGVTPQQWEIDQVGFG